jgi:hypothetical protein
MKRTLCLLTSLTATVFAIVVFGCGGVGSPEHAKTPDEVIEDQEQAADVQAKESKEHGYTGEVGETEIEEKKKWDERQAVLEVKRAVRSAESCPASLPTDEQKKVEKGVAKVSMLFSNDGHVKSAEISAPYPETPVGACVLRAMKAIIVPAFTGSEHPMEWEVDLTGKKKDAPAKEE